MRASVEHQMTEIYCFVDDFLRTHPGLAHWRRSPHAQPQFSDAEVLTPALLQGGLVVATLKQTYRLVAQNWRTAFPALPVYHQWVTRLHLLRPQVSELLAPTCGHWPPACTCSTANLFRSVTPFATAGAACCATRGRTLGKAAKAGSLALNSICCAMLRGVCSMSS